MSEGHFKLSYSPALNGLRGIAILMVMSFHARLLKGGFIGVDIFFVLSGFLITSLLVSEFDQYGAVSLSNFYMRRVLRLGPALIALLIVFCVVSFALLDVEKASSNYIDALISLFYLSNWARAFSIHPPDFLGHTWSLSIEEQFYIFWPIILLTLLRVCNKRYQVVVFTVAIVLLSWILRIYLLSNGATPDRLYNGLDTRADALMVGCTLGVTMSFWSIRASARNIFSKLLVIIALVSMACLLAFLMFGKCLAPWMLQYGYLVTELLAAILVIDVLISPQSVIRKLLTMRWLVWVGSISYGLYLWHFPVYKTMGWLGFDWLPIRIFGTLVTFFIAILSYYVMEKPILRLKKRFTRTIPNNSIQPIAAPLNSVEAVNK